MPDYDDDGYEIVYVDSEEEADEIEYPDEPVVPAAKSNKRGIRPWQAVAALVAVTAIGGTAFSMMRMGAPDDKPSISERVGAKVDETKQQAKEKKEDLTERVDAKVGALRADPDACKDGGKMAQKAYWAPDGKRPTMQLRLTGDSVELPPAIGDRIIAEPSRKVISDSVWVYQQDDRQIDVFWVQSLNAAGTDSSRQSREQKSKRRIPGAPTTTTEPTAPLEDSWWKASVATAGELRLTGETSGPDAKAYMPTVTYSGASCATIGGGSYRVVGDGLPATAEGAGAEQVKVAALKADAADPAMVWLVIEGELVKSIFEYAEDEGKNTDGGNTATVDANKEQTDGE
ncbi:hypothetical protein ABH922_001798 [Rhodococcus sp. 27YEA15]|uniref:hypothetical protein n=1 Tax=Rhodococcus sp. 27YEA15 TaxID=3156259 RepID=UPI003C7C5C23